jgi:multidrug transporter EmrE-like cation transporter
MDILSDDNKKTLFWITIIVAAELTAFVLLQKSIDSKKNRLFYITTSILLFTIVPLAFRETLKVNSIAMSNFYWIVLSEIGAVIVGYLFFTQKLSTREWIAISLLVLASIITLTGA